MAKTSVSSCSSFISSNVSYLQQFLKGRGVSVNSQRKQEFIFLCQAADRLSIEIDPDGLLEDRTSVVTRKLTVPVGTETLPLPTLLRLNIDI